MIFAADRAELAEAAGRAAAGLPVRPAQPVRAGMLITCEPDYRAELTCGDGDMVITATVSAEVTEPGSVILPGRMLAEVSRYLTGKQVMISCEGSTAVITAGRTRITLSAAPGDTYPAWSTPPPPLFTLDAAGFCAALKKVTPAASDTEPVLRTVCLTPGQGGELFLVSTNRSCLAVMVPEVKQVPAGESPYAAPFLAPVSAMERFARTAVTGTMGIGWDKHLIAVNAPGLHLTARGIQGAFMPWQKVLQTPQAWVKADTAELVRAVKMAALAAYPGTTIECIFEGADLIVAAAGQQGKTQEYISTDYSGDRVVFLLGSRMVLDGLAGCGEAAELAFTAPPAPVYLRGQDGYLFMIKPRRELAEEM